jgi:hypothetical protein
MFESAVAMAWTVLGVTNDADLRQSFIDAAHVRAAAQAKTGIPA